MLPTINFDTRDFLLAAADMAEDSVRFGAAAYAITRHHGLLLQTKVKAYASKPRTGPPGPRIQTGDYNRSISLNMGMAAGSPVATVGTNKPQGRRLEYGFVGVDAIGRHYNQPPYPHFRPALWEVAPLFAAAIAAIASGGGTSPAITAAPGGGGPRRVRTQAGVERYGKGIGEVI